MWLFVLNAVLCSLNRSKKFFQFSPNTFCCSPGKSVCTPRPDQVGLFEQVGDEGRLSAIVGKRSPCTCSCVCLSLGSGDFT